MDGMEEISQERENGTRLTELGDDAGHGVTWEGGKAGSDIDPVRYV